MTARRTLTADLALPLGGTQLVLTKPLTIGDGATLTANPGAIIKAITSPYYPYYTSASISVAAGGTLTAAGTPANPVVFTSRRDDSVGGDYNATQGAAIESAVNDVAAVPSPGDWEGISLQAGGTAVLENARISYPNAAISATGSSTVKVTREIRDSHAGVEATGEPCVDARNVDWGGDSNGPYPMGNGPSVRGNCVNIVPVKQWAETWQQNTGGTTGPPPSDPVCKDYLLIGVRGSGESPHRGGRALHLS